MSLPNNPIEEKVNLTLVDDASLEGTELEDKEWYQLKHHLAQQKEMIKTVTGIFTWLNGAVMLFVFVAWIGGFYGQAIITEKVVMTLISGVIVQAGLVFVSITKYLFPAPNTAK